MVKFIRYSTLYRFYENIQPFLKYSLVREDALPGKETLVIAPHPDDESIGCGGTISRHIQSGGSAAVVFCTMDSEERRTESREAVSMMGASAVYLDHAVEKLDEWKGFPERLAEIIGNNKPDTLFLPFFLDNHTDHRAANRAAILALETAGHSCMIYAYPVWFPVYPTVIVDIASQWEQKKRIISCYKSQLATRDYIRMSGSLAGYWAEVKGHGLSMVETFFRASSGEYAGLAKKAMKW